MLDLNRFTKQLEKMIAVNKVAFSIVEHDGFNHLLKLLDLWYKPPSSKYFSEILIPEMHEKSVRR